MLTYVIDRFWTTVYKRKPCGCCVVPGTWRHLTWYHGAARTPNGHRRGKAFLDEHAARMAFRRQLKAEFPGVELVEESC